MVNEEVFDRIWDMLDKGYTYRQIRKELGVGNWTISRVKKYKMLIEGLRGFFNRGDFVRLCRRVRKEEARLTWDKLVALWDYWSWMEFFYVEQPLRGWRKAVLLDKIVDSVLLGIYQIWLLLDQLYQMLTYGMLVVLKCIPCTGALCVYPPATGLRGYPPLPCLGHII